MSRGSGTRAAIAAGIVLLAIAVRLIYVFGVEHDYDRYPVRIDNWAALGSALADGHGYAVLSNETGRYEPTVYRTPLYPMVLAGLFTVFGDSDRVGLVAQCLIDGGTTALLLLLGLRVTGRFRVGVLAGLAFALAYPEWKVLIRLYGTPLFTLLVTAILVAAWGVLRHPTRKGLIGLGLVCGLAALARPTGSVFFPVVLIWTVAVLRRTGSARAAVWTAAAFLVTVSPWVVRNQVVFGEPVLADSNGGHNLYIGTLGTRVYMSLDEFDPAVRERIAGMGELGRSRVLARLAVDRVLEDPVAHLGRSARRLGAFLFMLSPTEFHWRSALVKLVPGLVAYGLAWVGWRRSRGALRSWSCLAIAMIAVMALLHALVVTQPRLFVPVLPALALLAAVGALARGGQPEGAADAS